MSKRIYKGMGLIILLATVLLICPISIQADIAGITGSSFSLTAAEHYISTPDGGVIFMWGYSPAGSLPQYPGPTLIVNEGQPVTINLTNSLSVPTSIVFPGQDVIATGGSSGVLTAEAAPSGGAVSYSFTPDQPGTYTYYSGTNPDLQIEMGLAGALIVRPAGYDGVSNRIAYTHADSAYDREYLFFLTDMDPRIHHLVESGDTGQIDNNEFWPVYWFINGRCFPDTIDAEGAAWLPTQPYSSLTLMHPGEKLLMRVIGAGRDLHPFHHHASHASIIAKDGRTLSSTGAEIDLAQGVFTIPSAPGQTVDAIFEWTGKDLWWDFYGHSITDSMVQGEVFDQSTLAAAITPVDTSLTAGAWDNNAVPSTRKIKALLWDSLTYVNYTDAAATGAVEMITMKAVGSPANSYVIERGLNGTTASAWSAGVRIEYTDHGLPVPVILPEYQNTAIGGVYAGSPFMGNMGALPPGEGGLNPYGAFVFPWHSHAEKELLNNNVFIGGMLTLLFIVPDSVVLP